GKVLEQRLGDRVNQLGLDYISLEGILDEVSWPRRVAPSSERIIDLILRPQGQQRREIAALHCVRRDAGRAAVIARPRVVNGLKSQREKGLVPPVIQLGKNDRTADRETRAVGIRIRARLSS